MNSKNKKILGIIFIILFTCFCLYKFSKFFAAGSYPFAEYYDLNYSEAKVLRAIEIVKQKNPDLNVGNGFVDDDNSDYWHHLWFNLEENTVMTWTRPFGKNKTTFALVSVFNGNGNWQDVNNDLGFFENRRIKKEFEKLILQKVEIELKNQ
ncbi:hypothetical protein FNO01nite_34870 [Flavobacterium noncentrifugens]|uniref:Uncharacterized protein n=1 Tax=Flavobacterium noncentrifugens TaxID=1128970 RepID=A0A1G9DGS6_9FLAO|nr:hypothetical protein [Flavobacterium noncentrifugens]GEP52815.1 hypothetical protein FNO01nite_34870 [Flavobacterium noncentrifugens]SDK63088.1 hypothetical protein SAMN04487935_3816 [Flavobacterium noncentrifugens]